MANLEGRVNFGGGMLELARYEVANLLIVDPKLIPPTDTEILKTEEWNASAPSKHRKLLDEAVFDAMGFSTATRDDIYEAVSTLVRDRKNKAASTQRAGIRKMRILPLQLARCSQRQQVVNDPDPMDWIAPALPTGWRSHNFQFIVHWTEPNATISETVLLSKLVHFEAGERPKQVNDEDLLKIFAADPAEHERQTHQEIPATREASLLLRCCCRRFQLRTSQKALPAGQ